MFAFELLHLGCAFLSFLPGVGDVELRLFLDELDFEFCFLDLLVLEFFELFLELCRAVVMLLYFVLELGFSLLNLSSSAAFLA